MLPLDTREGTSGYDPESLLHSTKIAALFLDEQLNIRSFTPALRTIYDLTAADQGRPVSCIAHRAVRMPSLPLPEEIRERGPMEDYVQTTDGRWFLRRVLPFQAREGTYDGLVILFIDITSLYSAEKILREGEQYYAYLIRLIPAALYVCDAQGRVILYNDAAVEFWGRRPVLGRDLWCSSWQIYTPEGEPLPPGQCPIARTLREGRAVRGQEILIELPDGSRRHILPYSEPIFDSKGTLLGAINMLVDISERKQAEQATAHLAAIVESSDDAIISKNLDGMILSWNTGATRLFGYSAQEAIGRHISLIIPPDRQDEERLILSRILKGERVSHYETVRKNKDGHLLDISLMISPIRDQSGRIIGASKIARDITERKRAEQALEEAHRVADAANRAKSEFLANMSHEIRTPMTAILGYTELLSTHLKDPSQLQYVATIQRNGYFLLEIINDILDLSKIEAGRMETSLERVSIEASLADVRSLMEVRAREKNLSLSFEAEGLLPETIQTDAKRLRQILINLLGNAIKFTEEGGVRLVTRLLPEREPLQIDVIDTGIGISKEQQTFLFRPFTQVDASVTRGHGGTGLGLTISRRLARMLGGDISVRSALGEGSTFTVTIATGPLSGVPLIQPLLEPLPTPMEVRAVERPRLSCRVLVVDDYPEIRELARRFIEEAGGEVLLAGTGQEALDTIQSAEETGRPVDLVIIDMQMPVMDGYEATRRMRAAGFTRPIIALTAHAMQGDRERCLAAGCDDHTTKPLRGEHLINLIARYTRDRAAPTAREGKGQAQQKKNALRVLLVEDNADLRESQGMLLEMLGYEILEAGDGRSAIELARAHPPDVVLLDLGLPDMSGYEVLKELKSFLDPQRTVSIALSGRSGEEERQRSLAAGFDHHVVKPADIEELRALFQRQDTAR